MLHRSKHHWHDNLDKINASVFLQRINYVQCAKFESSIMSWSILNLYIFYSVFNFPNLWIDSKNEYKRMQLVWMVIYIPLIINYTYLLEVKGKTQYISLLEVDLILYRQFISGLGQTSLDFYIKTHISKLCYFYM